MNGLAGFGLVVLIIALIVFVIVGVPWLVIWSINGLAAAGGASFAIPWSFSTWGWTFLLLLFFGGTASASR